MASAILATMAASESSGDESHTLHERMTHVSRLATMGEMAAGISHEINQPLAAISNYARASERLLAMSHPDLGEVRSALREIASEALRAADIIQRLRRLVGRRDPAPVPTDVNDVVDELRVLAQADARQHEARIHFDLGEGLPPLNLDRVQFQHALLNLVRNALEALLETPVGARTVVVRTRRAAGGEVDVDVCDNGPGVSPEILDRMFHPFSTTKASGTGLGLPISQTIVRSHGGTIAHNANVPRGACFRIRIPPSPETQR
jgi:two-component system sensor kinase FixL